MFVRYRMLALKLKLFLRNKYLNIIKIDRKIVFSTSLLLLLFEISFLLIKDIK